MKARGTNLDFGERRQGRVILLNHSKLDKLMLINLGGIFAELCLIKIYSTI